MSNAEKNLKALSFLVIWGFWLARNRLLFDGSVSTPEIVGAMTVGLHSAFPIHIRAAN